MPVLTPATLRRTHTALQAGGALGGYGMRTRRTVGGTVVSSLRKSRRGSAFSLQFPFQVSTRDTPNSDPATLDRIVAANSRLLKSLSPVLDLPITGLAATDEVEPYDSEHPELDDPGWALHIANDEIWLEVTCTAGVPTSANIRSLGAEDEWEPFEFSVEDDPAKCLVEWSGDGIETPFQTTKTRAVIARTWTDDDDIPHLIQVAKTDFVLVQWDISGKVLWVLQPSPGAPSGE